MTFGIDPRRFPQQRESKRKAQKKISSEEERKKTGENGIVKKDTRECGKKKVTEEE